MSHLTSVKTLLYNNWSMTINWSSRSEAHRKVSYSEFSHVYNTRNLKKTIYIKKVGQLKDYYRIMGISVVGTRDG